MLKKDLKMLCLIFKFQGRDPPTRSYKVAHPPTKIASSAPERGGEEGVYGKSRSGANHILFAALEEL